MSFLSDAVNYSQTGIDFDGETTVTEVKVENIPTEQVNVDDTDEPPPGPSTSAIHPSRSKKRKQSKLQETLDKRESQRLNLLKTVVNNTQKQPQVQPPSATKKFFESMAEVVETFPPREQAIIRAKVCQLITDVEIELSSTGTPMPEHAWDSDYFNLRKSSK